MIKKEEVIRIYDLAHLNLEEDRVDILAEKYTKVLDFAEIIMEVDTDNIEPKEMIQEERAVFREDILEESLDREKALENAKDREYGYFRLKKVID